MMKTTLTTRCLLVPDVEALRRKLANPSPLLARLYVRFQARLQADAEFRQHHIFLPALLGEAAAIAEAKERILALANDHLLLAKDQSPSSKATAQESLDAHVWCVAPRAMRLAVYFTWLDAQGAWTPAERQAVGTGLLEFCHRRVVPVLRARTPAGHNQQFSMCFSCAVIGQAFVGVDGVGEQAAALREWALPKLQQVLGLMPGSGYSGEGSTYQSDVVSALVMWAGVFLEQLGERDVWQRRWAPNDTCLADSLKLESAMGSCGGLLPPWDHYGWGRIHNLAARTLWAGLSGNPALLPVAETAWDETDFIAWRADDRMWTLIYWPGMEAMAEGREPAVPPQTPSPLTGWSLPAVGGAIEQVEKQLRVMLAWDRCSGGLQGVCRGQVNPNHLIVDLGGEPLTADGWEDGRVRLVPDAAVARTLAALTPVERDLLAQQYGSVETWVRHNQHGFLGTACSVIVDGWESYFPRQEREGRRLFERREPDRHTLAGESAAYYQPAFDVRRMRRTVSMNDAGVTWIVDDIRAESNHDFTWRSWFRREARLSGPRRLLVEPAPGVAATLAWAGEAGVVATLVPTFPQARGDRNSCWPDGGSLRCDLTATGAQVRFVACLVPAAAADLEVRSLGGNRWEATWSGGRDAFELPAEVLAASEGAPVTGAQGGEAHELCDLDEPPFALREEPDAVLLAELAHPPVSDWARTGAAMQTLVARGNRESLPKIEALLLDTTQNYTVHSVAAWCLGRAAYAPALETLRRMSKIPEDNTAARARWAVEILTGRKEGESHGKR